MKKYSEMGLFLAYIFLPQAIIVSGSVAVAVCTVAKKETAGIIGSLRGINYRLFDPDISSVIN